MATTDGNGILFYETTDSVSPLQVLLNSGQTSVSNALSATARIFPVATVAARAALATSYSPTTTKPLYVFRADAGAGQELEYTVDGTNWIAINNTKHRNVAVTASGTLAAATDLCAAQAVVASPVGPGVYGIRINASMQVSIPSGLGAQLDVRYDGTSIGQFVYTNAGGSSCTATLAVDRTISVSDALSHTVRVVATPLAGSVVITAGVGTFVEVQAIPMRLF